MGQVYLEGGDSFIEADLNFWAGQTFRVEHDHTLETLDLDITIPAFIPDPTVRIFEANAYHEPFGSVISRDRWMEYPYIMTGIRKRVRFQMQPVLLKALFYYVIILDYTPPIWGGNVDWFYNAGTGTYPRGHRIHSVDQGVTWVQHYYDDHMFAEFGEPYSPPSPPTPPIFNWMITEIWFYTSTTGMVVVVATNVPCHLTMHQTETPVLKHISPRLRRGTQFSDILRYCFVAYTDHEQEEAGDTLLHTFFKPDWPVCETRWFTFTGQAVGQNSPSTSAIFTKHRTETMAPLTYGPIIGTPSNRTIQGNHGIWVNCHDAPAGVVGPWHDAPTYYIIGGATLTATFWIERGFLFFDTSGIPPGSLIVGATLSIFALGFWCTSSIAFPNLCITHGVQDDPVIPTNFGDQLPHTIIGGQRDLRTLVLNEYNEIEFNSDGFAFINMGGITKLCIRQEIDVINWEPFLGSNQGWWNSTQKGDGHQPLLTVQYVPWW